MKHGLARSVAASVFASVMFLSCAVVSHHSHTTPGSRRSAPGESTLRQIRPGETTREWVLHTLGRPTSEKAIGEGAEMLRYEYTETVKSKFGLLFVIDIDTSTEERESLYIELQDGIVERYWRD